MDHQELKAKFTKEFFEEFQFDAEFRAIFFSIAKGVPPYKVIEHLCESKKELIRKLNIAIESIEPKIKRLEDKINED